MAVNRDYRCQECGRTEIKRTELNDIVKCDSCAAPMQRMLSAPAGSGNSAHGFLKKKVGFNN